jgi:NADPH-dependent 2,4-dienoyl-CoA reductase/sulfur reductase-like enzyme
VQNLNVGGGVKKLDLKAMTMNLSKPKQNLPFKTDKEYDCIVIGGGTGGLSFAQEARKLGMSVALFDYVDPSPQ